ncbi:MAG: glycoside hydrolase family 28 protein [Lachnospiraceae bacterium]|nr:glycoside hydrolase family 28 protein [Lachnospiraceae bacterium]
MLKTICITPRSVTFDINDGGKYYTKSPYSLKIKANAPSDVISNPSETNLSKGNPPEANSSEGNPSETKSSETEDFSKIQDVSEAITLRDNRSIITIFGLQPDTEYCMEVSFEDGGAESLSFTTAHESATVNVREFGAFGDGEHDDTAFIMSAIMCCPEEGRVLIPEGTYRHTGIYLKSNIRVELAKGARLAFVNERTSIPRFPAHMDYKAEKGNGTTDREEINTGSTSANGSIEYFLGTWEGEPQPMFNGTVNAIGVKNACIYGEGTIDGCATKEDWWLDPKVIRMACRPRLIFMKGSENVVLQGVTLTNSPAWTVHPFFSKNVGFYNITIKNPWDSPNTDGIDPESCDGVEIAGVHFSLGDDCIAVKSGKIDMGRKFKTPCKNIHIYGCLMEDGHGAVTVGSEAAAGVCELVVDRCNFMRTDRGLRVKTRRGRGKDSVMDNIIFRDIDMDGVITPFVVNSFYYCDVDGKTDYVQDRNALPVDERTPVIKRLVFENIHAVNSHYAAGWIEGLPEQPIEEIVLHDIYVGFAENAKKGIPAMANHVPECSREGFIVKNVVHMDEKNVIIDK